LSKQLDIDKAYRTWKLLEGARSQLLEGAITYEEYFNYAFCRIAEANNLTDSPTPTNSEILDNDECIARTNRLVDDCELRLRDAYNAIVIGRHHIAVERIQVVRSILKDARKG